MEKPSFYAVIPANVRYSEMSPSAKLLYGELTALTSKEGYCWASNDYFAQLYHVKLTTVSEWVKILSDKGFIRCVFVGRNIRHIYLSDSEKTVSVIRKKPNSDSEKAEHSITSITTEKTTSLCSDSLKTLFQPVPVQEDERAPRNEKDVQLKKASSYWRKLCLAEAGSVSVESPFKAQALIKEARKHLSYAQIKEMMIAWFQEQSLPNDQMIQITRCLSAKQIDKYLSENV